MVEVPRRLVYRAVAGILWNQARVVESRRAARIEARRRGSLEGASAKELGRERQAAELRSQAAELSRRVGDADFYEGRGLPAAVLGWLCVLALGDMDAVVELGTALAPIVDDSVLVSMDWLDLPEVLGVLMPVARG